MKPCNHTPPKHGCRLCWLFEHDARYRQLWGGDPATVTAPVAQAPAPPQPTAEQLAKLEQIKTVIRKPCVHLGMALEEKPSCGCGGKPALLHECGVYGKCRPYAPRQNEVRECVGCDRYQPE
jgi:hypothetical protein